MLIEFNREVYPQEKQTEPLDNQSSIYDVCTGTIDPVQLGDG